MGYSLSPFWWVGKLSTPQAPPSADRVTEEPRLRALPRVLERFERPREAPRRFDHEEPSFENFHARWWGLKF